MHQRWALQAFVQANLTGQLAQLGALIAQIKADPNYSTFSNQAARHHATDRRARVAYNMQPPGRPAPTRIGRPRLPGTAPASLPPAGVAIAEASRPARSGHCDSISV